MKNVKKGEWEGEGKRVKVNEREDKKKEKGSEKEVEKEDEDEKEKDKDGLFEILEVQEKKEKTLFDFLHIVSFLPYLFPFLIS